MRIVLASASPRRREICALLGIQADICPASRERAFDPGLTVSENVLATARNKAEQVFRDVGGFCPVVGADTVVALDYRVFGKPKDEEDAKRMLAALQGRTHRVLTGVWVCGKDNRDGFVSEAEVTFLPMTPCDIAEYIATGEPMDKAGAYGIQGLGARYIAGICGDFFTVMGLPASLWRFLRNF